VEPAESEAVLISPLEGGGVSGDLVRVHLRDGSTRIAKRPSADPIVRERQRALGMYEREARFYAELADRVSVRTPQCFHASDDLLVLEDLAPAVAGTFTHGLDPARVEAVIDALVAMHGEWQGRAELGRLPWLWRVERAEADRWQANLEVRLPRFVDRHGQALSRDALRLAERVTTNLPSLMVAAAALPPTLCHGDPGPPNLMFGHPRGEPVLIDWQLVAARSGALDLAWLLALGVPEAAYEHRRNAWLARYRDPLGLDPDAFANAYALGVALAARAPIWMGGAPESERNAHVDAYATATIPRAFVALLAEEGRHSEWLT
jgi:aminoglycoside/choline kinase family phosphotransferase